ncbi:hypothetical protein NADFUDRAFT_21636 [Nadsonia fulvescens var. elongata DSM 6958]|uniref:Integral membrane protein n=1 Tax=Nadsonia fulvescens var. elongata DSM 6958 TaxID=857566 RepID=A0A1E3PQF3_9ASCO|nr:hypothetical protein NADFUDRAFT_21636 [Nadsonia fulvescens var. elongata DSM 6958]
MKLPCLSIIVLAHLLLGPLSVNALGATLDSSVTSLHHGSCDINNGETNCTNIIPSPAKLHSGHSSHGMPILNMTDLEPQQRLFWEQYDTTTYWSIANDHKVMLYLHTFSLIISVMALYPISIMLSITKSPFYIPVLTTHLIVMLFSLLAFFIYEPSTPAYLYPNNAYTKMSIILFFVTIVHYVAAIVKSLSEWVIAAGTHDIVFDDDNSDTIHSISSAHDDLDIDNLEPVTGQPFETKYQNQLMANIMANKWVNSTVCSFGYLSTLVFSLFNPLLFIYHVIFVFTGVAWSFRIGMGNQVFNVLAHFIKGGVFFLFGLLTWARFIGAWADKGWAWNLNPNDETQSDEEDIGNDYEGTKIKINKKLTMEFIECFLIFFYGSTNIFMEHMANTNGAWSVKDLQHASIAFMFLGGGLAGLLCESQVVSRFLPNKKHAISFNPFGAFVIFWTGILMSQHEQEIPTSTIIHSQWGNLLATAAVFRLFTYTLLYLKPPTNAEPTRPFTEAIVSFCLIAGGLVFIQSNTETVLGMVYRGIDGMFTLNVTVGATALLMSWQFVVFAIKGWSERS